MAGFYTFGISEAQIDALEAAAKAMGESEATFLRRAILERIKRIERRKPLRDKMESLK